MNGKGVKMQIYNVKYGYRYAPVYQDNSNDIYYTGEVIMGETIVLAEDMKDAFSKTMNTLDKCAAEKSNRY